MSFDEFGGFPDRDELLEGLPTKRADTTLFLIESRTAHLVAGSRRAMEIYLTEEAAKGRDMAFVEAFALGREPPLRPTIQNLEGYAAQWADLVPENPRIRAAVAHRLGQKYRVTYRSVPGIRTTLGLDAEEVKQAYQRLYHQPLDTIYGDRAGSIDRLRWAWAALSHRLENLPPFWTAFSLTLTETIGATILALPIALASVGPLPGVAILVVLGIINMVTVALIAESVTRSGTIRYGDAFIGRLAGDYLGRSGSLIVALAVFAICFLVLQAYYIGVSSVLEDATGVPAAVWAALLFLVGLYFLRRESLNATVASALLVGAVTISLILILSLLAFAHLRPANFLYTNLPFLDGRPFEPSVLALVFGVILTAYFGHLSVSNCGRVVLRRDPSGRSLIWGAVAAQATAILLYSTFVLAINGAVSPQVLARETGTTLSPLAAQTGPIIIVLGSVFVVLGMGMASIHFSLALFNLAREWLPTASQPVVLLNRRRGTLLFSKRGGGDGPNIGLMYLGLRDGKPHFALNMQTDGKIRRLEATPAAHWDVGEVLRGLGSDGGSLSLDIMEATKQAAHVRLNSSLSLKYEGEWDTAGVSLADILALPDAEAEAVILITRHGEATLREVAEHTGRDAGSTGRMLSELAERGLIGQLGAGDECRYVARATPRRGRQLPTQIWHALEQPEESAPAPPPSVPLRRSTPRIRRWLLTGHRRFLLAASPVVLALVSAEWMLLTGTGSFTWLLGFAGVIVVALLAGIFPVLLLVAGRRKGEYVPPVVYRFLGNPLLLGSIYVLSLSSVLLHGFVIWTDPVQRACALAVGALIVVMTMVMARRGAFAHRLIIELREDVSARADFSITASGQPVAADVRLKYPDKEQLYQGAAGEVPDFSRLRQVSFGLRPDGQAQELKVWAHRLTPEGDSEALPARMYLRWGDETQEFDLQLSRGQAVVPMGQCPCEVGIVVKNPGDAVSEESR